MATDLTAGEAPAPKPQKVRREKPEGSRLARWGLRYTALLYLGLLLLLPIAAILQHAFEDGIGTMITAITTPDAIAALRLTLLTVVIAVPLNTVFGIACAHLMVRTNMRGKAIINGLIDIPFAVSPIVVGLALILVYGTGGWFGAELAAAGIQVIFSTPGIVMAVIFVSMPFVAREVIPVLQEIGDDQEKAAETLGASGWYTFWRITLPAIRWGVSYGVVLTTARALGEFGAVTVVSGRISGETETLPLYVQKQFETFNSVGAYSASLVLALIALATLLALNLMRRKES
ncbi:MAG: sulfate ABC transporter permease subunit CysW [Actinomycetota bacterium]|nr:sulfate ABC transporter permease subunit CysW [Actinomycetota bacterium]